MATDTTVVSVRVKPGSRKEPLVEVGDDGELTVYVPERAVDGKANDAVTRLLAEHLGVPRSQVSLVGGATARIKRFRVG
ncbi:hypothetical protein ASD37_02835 [Mycobacterium sp. Root135]|uniref:DUF167 domain-containing protein n=1 Tax=Mycobacterium sp. Root135 TaxID=1736457 RepID=UPI0006F2E085|nr:DUF167 domain-containing protein [Mycobacterium sp. Root135]KQY09392.1 hypothetical protein ASD37_02835 [Mycobacterium sp. Root135]